MGAAQVSDPNVLQYGVGKNRTHLQTGPGQTAFTSFTFQAFIDLRPDGVLTSAVLQGPLLGGVQSLSLHSTGANFESAQFTGEPTTAKGNLNGNFADSTPGNAGTNYSLVFTTVPGTTYSVGFSLAGDNYPEDIPQFTLDNGQWTEGGYQLDAGQTVNFGWAFPGYNAATDMVVFRVRPAGGDEILRQQFQGSHPGGFAVTAGTFAPGTAYVAELGFARVVASNPNAVAGAQGVAFYALQTNLTFTAVPEPSTYALLALGLGVVLLPVLRRRFRR